MLSVNATFALMYLTLFVGAVILSSKELTEMAIAFVFAAMAVGLILVCAYEYLVVPARAMLGI